jgi:asparagine synthase (glutamine-hydrolysing)
MAGMMTVRGPDGEGRFCHGPIGMAMRRLSIIDLEGGWQPFFSQGESIVAFQNGEIYNYRDLQVRLERHGHRFLSASDTEVLAHGYAEWGIAGLLDRLDGMFALAILDLTSRDLHLARDRYGEKPLFYTTARRRFAYASDLGVLASLPWVDEVIGPDALRAYLALHYVPGDATLFRSIRRVLPGERLVVSIDRPDEPHGLRYFRPSLEGEEGVCDDELAEIVERAVESRLVADVPVGVFLSGGLDSSLVAAIAARAHHGIATFSMGFHSAAHDESAHAMAVARSIGSDHHHFRFDETAFETLIPAVAAALDEPLGDQAALPLYRLCQEARRHVTVALSGEGADEVFGGYGYYQGHAAAPARDRLLNEAGAVTPSGFPLLTDARTRARLVPDGCEANQGNTWETEYLAWLATSKDSLRRSTAADLGSWLADDLLVKFDRMSMAHSLEGRAPYLSPRVVTAGLGLPAADKVAGNQSKLALRRVAARWLPPAILERNKQGFVLPMAAWLRGWFAHRGRALDYFHEREVPGLDPQAVADLVQDDLDRGVKRQRLLFALVLLVEWYAAFQRRRRWKLATHSDWLVV